MGGGVSHRRELQVVHPGLGDHVKAPEGEEQVRLHAFAECGVGEDQTRVGHIQVALGADDCELAVGLGVVVEGGDEDVRCGGHVGSFAL
jgi:hypothetical protein